MCRSLLRPISISAVKLSVTDDRNSSKFSSTKREQNVARTFRCMETVEEETVYDIQRQEDSIPHISLRRKSAISDLAMWIIKNEKNKELVAVSDSVDYMVALLQCGNEREKEIAACALHRLATNEQSRNLIAQRGGIVPLLDLIQNGTALQKNQAVAALAALAVKNENNKLLISQAGGVTPLLYLTQNGTEKQKSLAVRALYCLAKDEQIRDEIYQKDGITAILELVKQNDTPPNLKRYATAMLQLFSSKIPLITRLNLSNSRTRMGRE